MFTKPAGIFRGKPNLNEHTQSNSSNWSVQLLKTVNVFQLYQLSVAAIKMTKRL